MIKNNRKQATRYIQVIDELLAIATEAEVPQTVLNQMVGIEYITCVKYLAKERNIMDATIAQRMVVTTDILKRMVKESILPIPSEVSSRLRSSVILDRVDTFIAKTN